MHRCNGPEDRHDLFRWMVLTKEEDFESWDAFGLIGGKQ